MEDRNASVSPLKTREATCPATTLAVFLIFATDAYCNIVLRCRRTGALIVVIRDCCSLIQCITIKMVKTNTNIRKELRMKKYIIALGITSLFSFNVFASIPPGNDVTTKPELYYLKNSDAVDSLLLLPPPPKIGSIAFLNDQAMYENGRLLRNTERGKQAAEDANLSSGGVANAFSAAFGAPITEENLPELHKLLTNMIEDAGDLATRSAKEYYMRIRPFAFYGVSTCNTKEQNTLSKNGSYPSGHTSIGWATALVLSEINPARQDIILKRGYELGESRVICGYHWQSDVDAARTVGSAIVATLHSNPFFQEQLLKAKNEFIAHQKK